MNIHPIFSEEKIPYDLLLLADPSMQMIEKYLAESTIHLAMLEREIVGVLVLFPLGKTLIEIKNIAVSEIHQGKGIGKMILQYAILEAKEKGFQEIQIGTANSSIGQLALYQKTGFQIARIHKDFFIDNYPEPMYENGILVRDMIILKMKL